MIRRIMYLWLLVLTSLVLIGSTSGAQSDFDGYWLQFRQRFPYHVQILALTPEVEGYQAVIISEPPPHVSVELFQAVTGISQVYIKEQKMGVDGYIRDLLCVIPAMDNKELESLLLTIHDYLFFSTYKAEIVEWPLPPKGRTKASAYDIEVSFAEIDKWLIKDNRYFMPVLGGKLMSFQEIFSNTLDGVYISEKTGLVIWVIPRNPDLLLEQFTTAARIWAVEADLVVGAVANKDCLVIVGRERNTSILDLPPLRTEEIMRLASADYEELAQSYERNHILAGRFNETDDWAPIYLSDILLDTEYGSLLCLTDQLLKSWTQNGTVHYANFQYSDPVVAWPWPKPLSEVLGASELTFNWNTQGVGFAVEESSNTFYGIGRTGALAVSYIPGGEEAFWADTGPDSNVVKYENLGYDFFAHTGDPNLARVVQYASLFQIFREFDIHATPPGNPAAIKQYGPLVTLMEDVLEGLSQLTVDDILEFSLYMVGLSIEDYESLSAVEQEIYEDEIVGIVDSLGGLISIINDIKDKNSYKGLKLLSEELVNTRQVIDSESDFYQRLVSLSDMSDYQVESFLLESGNFDIYVYMTALSLSSNPFYSVFLRSAADAAYAKQQYQEGCSKRKSDWIRTPSTVVSTSDDINSVGGHNLGSRLVKIKPSTAVKRGSPKIVEGPQGKILKIHPDDLKSSSTTNVIRSFERSGGTKAAEANIGRITKTAPREIRSVSKGLYKGQASAVTRTTSTEFRTLGGKRSLEFAPVEKSEYVKIIENTSSPSIVIQADGPVIKIFDMHPGGLIRTETRLDVVNAIVERLRMRPQSTTTLQIHVSGLSDADVASLMQSVKIKLAATPKVKSAGLAISNKSGRLATLENFSETFDFSRARISLGTSEPVIEGPMSGLNKVTFNVDVPMTGITGSKLMKIQVYLNKLKDGVIDKVKSTFNKTKSRPVKDESILIDIHKDLMQADEVINNIHIEFEDVLITEVLRQDKSRNSNDEFCSSEPVYVSLYLAA